MRILELLLKLIDAQGISSEDIEPHIQQAEADVAAACGNGNKHRYMYLRVLRSLEDFRWGREVPGALNSTDSTSYGYT